MSTLRSRTQSSIQNIVYSLIGQSASLIISFILRIIFVRELNKSYLGVDSLFTSLVTVLSLAELGIGSAINYSLYKPLAEKNIRQISLLMKLYKRAYIIIGVVVFIIGCAMTPFIGYISNTNGKVPNLKLFFMLFVINSSISYFYSYKKSLIIADQYRYITVVYNYTSFIIMSIVQGIVLICFKNYSLYLIVMITATFVQNVLVSKKADKMYPYLKQPIEGTVSKSTRNLIIKNSYAMSLHKLGGVVVNSTDSIIISRFLGIKEVGKYSNYLLVTNALNVVFGQIFTAVVASVGNLGATGDRKHTIRVFNLVLFLGFWLVSFCACCLFIMFNPFISLWVGKDYVLSKFVVAAIVLNFYIYQIRRPVLTFRDAMGIYWFDRYVPIVESILNLSISILLVRHMGLAGTLFGTIVSSLLTVVWIEPYMLYKHALREKVSLYFKKLVGYTSVFIGDTYITSFVSLKISHLINNEYMSFIVLALVCVVIFNAIFTLVFFNNENFKNATKLFKNIFLKFANRLQKEN